jgi:hypothetical protein
VTDNNNEGSFEKVTVRSTMLARDHERTPRAEFGMPNGCDHIKKNKKAGSLAGGGGIEFNETAKTKDPGN